MNCPFHVKDRVNSRPSPNNILSVDKSRRRGVADIPEGHRAWGVGGYGKLSNRPEGSGHVNLRKQKGTKSHGFIRQQMSRKIIQPASRDQKQMST